MSEYTLLEQMFKDESQRYWSEIRELHTLIGSLKYQVKSLEADKKYYKRRTDEAAQTLREMRSAALETASNMQAEETDNLYDEIERLSDKFQEGWERAEDENPIPCSSSIENGDNND